MTPRQETVSFVARLWLEPGPDDSSLWRGHVQHVQSSRSGYFHDLEGMARFLEDVTGVKVPLRAETVKRDVSEGRAT